MKENYDVIIIGGGLAGLSLARQLLLQGDKSILVLERMEHLPAKRMKVGESNVQVAGHYFAKVLDLEEHLYHQHVMKYNLRFMWKTGNGERFEDYSHSFIRNFSNIPCYQMDRNKLEGELLLRNRKDARFTLCENVSGIDIKLQKGGGHVVRFHYDGRTREATAGWLVDTSGRVRLLSSHLESGQKSSIHHSAVFFWTEGTVNIEKLTDATREEVRKRPERSILGHVPFWLATNHFCGEGFWFWVIPLHDRTSFGLVFDNSRLDVREVANSQKLLAWLFRRFPLFKRELSRKPLIDFQVLHDFSHDCRQTISMDRWAMSGFSGRFTDPLYSPGGDAIAIYNTLITDAILCRSDRELADKVNGYEAMMNVVYRSYLPSFANSYDALGDQETFSMKYIWELSIYFAFYVFPFINDLYTERYFLIPFLRRFSQLGELNRSLLVFISDYYHWKKENLPTPSVPRFFEFSEVSTLARAEKTFYAVGTGSKEALAILDRQLENLRELARFYVAHVSSIVAGNPDLVNSPAHVESIDLGDIQFDAETISRQWHSHPASDKRVSWSMDSGLFAQAFHSHPSKKK